MEFSVVYAYHYPMTGGRFRMPEKMVGVEIHMVEIYMCLLGLTTLVRSWHLPMGHCTRI